MSRSNRNVASSYGILPATIDNTLDDAFGQRIVSTIYTTLNQYHVILEVEPRFPLSPLALNRIYIPSATGQEVPLGQLVKSVIRVAPLIVNHQGQFPSVTLSFNLKPGVALGPAVNAIARVKQQLHVPASLATSFQGNAQAFTSSLSSEPILIAATLVVIYIILGVLYQSLIHPITIISTLPSAGLGALLMLMAFHFDLSVIAIIGIILLIGIVKKNGIMLIDFALEAERHQGLSPEQAIYPRLHTALSADPDDDNGGAVGGRAADARTGTGRDPSAAWLQHCRRADAVTAANIVHDAGRLPLSRPPRRYLAPLARHAPRPGRSAGRPQLRGLSIVATVG